MGDVAWVAGIGVLGMIDNLDMCDLSFNTRAAIVGGGCAFVGDSW